MAARFTEILEEDLPCLHKEKNAENIKRLFISE